MRAALRGLTIGASLAVAACARVEAPTVPAAEPPRSHVPDVVPDRPPAESRADRLCRSLAQILDSEPAGFADLRGGRLGDRRWQGRLVPPDMNGCTVDGDYYPGAEYVCRGFDTSHGGSERLRPAFDRLAADLDDCLGRRRWGERGWRRGPPIDFAYGERQITWRWGGNFQRPGLSLKIEEDLGAGGWYVRLAALTLR